MSSRTAACIVALILIGTPALGAELFYMDHDPVTKEYVGPTGPLVLSGEIAPGDYDRLLSKISEDENRFIEQNKLLLASEGGDVTEAIKIAHLVKALYTEVVVGPLTGRCVGVCFLIYAAADQRVTDGPRLIGIHRPEFDDADWDLLSPPDQWLLEEDLLAQTRALLQDNGVPVYLVDEMFRHTADDVYWLSERDEQALRAISPPFEQLLTAKCAWSDTLQQAVYKGERPMEDLKEMWACRTRITQPAAHEALALAVKRRSAPDTNAKTKPGTHCHKKGTAIAHSDDCPDKPNGTNVPQSKDRPAGSPP